MEPSSSIYQIYDDLVAFNTHEMADALLAQDIHIQYHQLEPEYVFRLHQPYPR